MTESHKELEPVPQPPEHMAGHCPNCGAELKGPFCHVCGQSTRHVIKHLPALLEDAADLVFNIDGRIMHTLPALYLRPGFLAREYFAGRRARYIPPFRLMFFLSVLAFLLMQFNLNYMGNHLKINPVTVQGNSPAEVRASFEKAEKQIEQARNQPDMPAIGRAALDTSERSMRAAANARLIQLGAAPLAAAASTAAPVEIGKTTLAQRYLQSIQGATDRGELDQRLDAAKEDIDTSLKSKALTPATRKQLESLRADIVTAGLLRKTELDGTAPAPAHAASRAPAQAAGTSPAASRSGPAPTLPQMLLDPQYDSSAGTDAAKDKQAHVHVSWLPGFVNDRINEGIDHARANLKAMRSGNSPEARTAAVRRMIAEMLSVLPQTLFVMLPLFAVLLKILYLFKRRLYIEHLMVAMYSHAFIYLSLLLWALVGLGRVMSPSWLADLLGWVEFAIFLWIPIYLLLMQKRVYAQGWMLTLLKYFFLGICYTVLLSLAVSTAALIGLAS